MIGATRTCLPQLGRNKLPRGPPHNSHNSFFLCMEYIWIHPETENRWTVRAAKYVLSCVIERRRWILPPAWNFSRIQKSQED